MDKTTIKNLEEFNNMINNKLNLLSDVLFYIESNFEHQGQSLDAPELLKKYSKKIKEVLEFRNSYISIFNKITANIKNELPSDFLCEVNDNKNKIELKLSLIEKELLNKYKKEHLSQIQCLEHNENLFKVSFKLKKLSPDIIEELICSCKFPKRLILHELTTNEDTNYVYELYSYVQPEMLSKQIAAIKKFIDKIFDTMINSDLYREIIYNNFNNQILTLLYEKEPEENYKLINFIPYDWQKDAYQKWICDSNIDKNNPDFSLLDDKYHIYCKVATGTGKTKFALYCIQNILDKGFDIRTRIIVPTIALMYQWEDVLINEFHVPPNEILLRGDGQSKNDSLFNFNAKYTIYVCDTATKTFSSDVEAIYNYNKFKNAEINNLIIADEMHHYASPENIKIFESLQAINRNPEIEPGYLSIGLSATPYHSLRNPSDELTSNEWKLYKIIGQRLYMYEVPMALADEIICPFNIVNVEVNLTESEKTNYDKLRWKLKQLIKEFCDLIDKSNIKYNYDNTIKSIIELNKNNKAKISDIYRTFEELKSKYTDDYSSEINTWLNKADINEKIFYFSSQIEVTLRKIQKLMFECTTRKHECLELVLKHQNDKVIIFSEYTNSIDEIYTNIVNTIGKDRTIRYHSKVKLNKELSSIIEERKIQGKRLDKKDYLNTYLSSFKDGTANILCTATILDEGLDVPDANVAIIFQGTESEKQCIQRLGRIIRKSNPNKIATLYWFYNPECEQEPFLSKYFNNRDSAAFFKSKDDRGEKFRKGYELIKSNTTFIKAPLPESTK